MNSQQTTKMNKQNAKMRRFLLSSYNFLYENVQK